MASNSAPSAGRCRSSPSPTPPARSKATPTSLRTTARLRSSPVPRTPAARPPAGSREPDAIRVCDLFDRPSLISFWFTKGGDDCVTEQDAVNRAYRRYGGRVRFLSVDIRDDRDKVRDLIQRTALADAGRLRPRRRRRRPLSGRRLPDLRLRLPRRNPAERECRRTERGQSSSSDSTRSCMRRPPPNGADDGSRASATPTDLGWEPAPEPGWVAPHVAAEFPGLAISSIVVDGRPGSSPEPVRRRLRDISDRFYGAHAMRMRERPIPWAYRAFFRQIGLDPDRTRTPVEELALERLREGAFKPAACRPTRSRSRRSRPASRCALFDADQIRGKLCIRDSAPGGGAGRSARRSCRRGRS